MKIAVTRRSLATADAVTLQFLHNYLPKEYKAGQHGAFAFEINGERMVRNYSLHPSADGIPGAAITIRLVRHGIVSQHVLNSEIDNIELEGLYGDFYIEPSPEMERHLIMFAAGSGITPIMAMIHTILSDEPGSLISLIYSNQHQKKIIFANELRGLQERFADRLRVYHVLTQSHTPASFPVFYNGRLSPLIVRKTVKKLLAECDLPPEFYVCGPHPFIQLVYETVSAMGLDNTKIVKEHFFIPAPDKSNAHLNNLPARDIIIQLNGVEKRLRVDTGRSILEAAGQHNLALRSSCREGQCGTCRSLLVSGEVGLKKNYILTADELEAGQILLCQAYPLSDNIIIQPVN